jgi:hypothetical protein
MEEMWHSLLHETRMNTLLQTAAKVNLGSGCNIFKKYLEKHEGAELEMKF